MRIAEWNDVGCWFVFNSAIRIPQSEIVSLDDDPRQLAVDTGDDFIVNGTA